MTSGFTDEMAITPNLGIEWSPTERFVSGLAQQGRLQMCSLFSVAVPSSHLQRDLDLEFQCLTTSTQQPNSWLLKG